MAMSLKERLAAKNAKTSTPTSKLSGLKNRLGNRGGSSGGGLRNKFKLTKQDVLDQSYEDREKRSKMSSAGKPIFNQELMEQYGVIDFSTTRGDKFVEILPISFNDSIPYFKEVPVHFGVGFAGSAYVCMLRYAKGTSKARCYRCEKQQMLYRVNNAVTDEIKKLYPMDRPCYLLWERTKELLENESPDYTLSLWAAPKKKVHAEIQNKVRDKINRTTLDISDVQEGGEGRTVGFTIVQQGDFPDYTAFDLIHRDKPIPEAILEKLDRMITDAEEAGYDNIIDYFLNIPEYDEIKEDMLAEDEMMKDGNIDAEAGEAAPADDQPSSRRSLIKRDTAPPAKNPEEELIEQLDELRGELESKSAIAFKMWCKTNGYADAVSMDQMEAIPLIIDDMFEKAQAEL